MSSATIMDKVLSKIKTVLSEAEELLASDVTPEQVEAVNRLFGMAMSAGWTAGLEAWLSTAETDAETIEVDGVAHRYKLDSEKEFLTPGGMIKLTRRVYQPDAGGGCHIPLDAAWGMENQFATVQVRTLRCMPWPWARPWKPRRCWPNAPCSNPRPQPSSG